MAAADLAWHEVSHRVNSVHKQEPKLIEPVAPLD